jgi:hypothetical protein
MWVEPVGELLVQGRSSGVCFVSDDSAIEPELVASSACYNKSWQRRIAKGAEHRCNSCHCGGELRGVAGDRVVRCHALLRARPELLELDDREREWEEEEQLRQREREESVCV